MGRHRRSGESSEPSRRSTRRSGESSEPSTSRRRHRRSDSDDARPPKRTREENESPVLSRRNRRGRLGDREDRSHGISDEAFRELNVALREDTDKKSKSQLKPTLVDLCLTKNREAHRTDEYEDESLIIRRGQTFDVDIKFDREYNEETDEIILLLATGDRPQESKQTIIRVRVGSDVSTAAWGMKITSKMGQDVSLQVMSPATAIVGKYSLFVVTNVKGAGDDGKDLRFQSKMADFILLFNAWCKDDSVFMDDESYREEYVLNDRGLIWMGSARKRKDWVYNEETEKYEPVVKEYLSGRGRPWNFGQFEDVSLEVVLHLLDKIGLDTAARASPVLICRVISQMANFNDDDGGVLYGKWGKEYPGKCTKPWDWPGSVGILEEFAKGKMKRVVKYGQCWVFSGLCTTLCRALGIPTRSVTNFQSAHDTDASMTIDKHYDEEGEPIDELDGDSVWNFHVWNEAFFRRPDLPLHADFDGWQAFDSTPQETSEGVFCCGPCPVNAIKRGELYIPYDAKFIFAEVNGDRVKWLVKEDGSIEAFDVSTNSVGKFISTKAVGSNERHDVTLEYKYQEGSKEEREAVHRANKYSSRRELNIYDIKPNDVNFVVDVDDDVMIGDDFKVTLKMKNTTNEKRTVRVRFAIKSILYTGRPAYNIKERKEETLLEANEDKSITLDIKQSDYIKFRNFNQPVNVFVSTRVQETGRIFNTIENFNFTDPELDAEVPAEDPKVNKDFVMTFKVTNPLTIKLKNCSFNVEASSWMKPRSSCFNIKDDVQPGKTASVDVKLKGRRRGNRSVNATFSCDQFSGVTAGFDVSIK